VPVAAQYHPDPRHHTLDGLFDVVEPASFPRRELRFRNQRWAERVGLGSLTDGEWVEHFAAFAPLPDNLNEPLALRYHGHQFDVYNPALGDGRGFLFAQLRDDRGRLLDLGTKGSGQTPYSRGGDGRLTLKGGVRELLATEMLEARGVSTSKTFSLVETGERLMRGDEPSPTRSCVLVRLSHSHVRFGTFQRLAHLDDRAGLERLLEYVVDTYYPELSEAADVPRALLRSVAERTAATTAGWMAAGFVHGVLNSDNMNITGESFDYGPYRFLPTYDPGFIAAYFDHTGLYAYGRQPRAVLTNLHRLADALAVLVGKSPEPALDVVFGQALEEALRRAMLRRLGVAPVGHDEDGALVDSVFELLAEGKMPFEQLFFDWYGGAASEVRSENSPHHDRYEGPAFRRFRATLDGFAPRCAGAIASPYFAARRPVTLLVDEVDAVWDRIARFDSWERLYAKVEAIREAGGQCGAELEVSRPS
jgi:uncharacterized protein YdiU (UPF0061 family)